jgi:hypothetical protein
LQTALAAKTHITEGQWLKKQLNIVNLCMFQAVTQMPTVLRTEGKYLVPGKIFNKTKTSMMMIQ